MKGERKEKSVSSDNKGERREMIMEGREKGKKREGGIFGGAVSFGIFDA